MTVDQEITQALRLSQLILSKMHARQRLLQSKLEDIRTDTELMLGPYSSEAEQFVEGTEKIHADIEECIDGFTTMHAEMQELFASVAIDPAKKVSAKKRAAFTEIAASILKLVDEVNEAQSGSLKTMTENVRIVADTHNQLRAIVASGL